MKGLLIDHNIRGQARLLIDLLEGPVWAGIWNELRLPIRALEEVALTEHSPDHEVWELCQQLEPVLLTANRNARGPSSLEATVRARGTASSLPVLTLANPDQVRVDRQYALLVVER
jgi:hypothetical protein